MLNAIRPLLATAVVLCPAIMSGQAVAREPIETTLCELVKEPEGFNGKIVQLRAVIQTGFELSVVRDDSCSASIWLTGPGVTYVMRTPRSTWPSITLQRDDEYRKMQDYLNKQYRPKRGSFCVWCPLYKVTARVTGRFDHVNADPAAPANK